MTTRTRLISIAVAVALAALAGWWFVLRSNAPPPVSLDEAIAELGTSTSTPEVATGSGSIDGQWRVTPGNGSFAGYRVDEQLVSVGFTTAAGRTTGVDAALTISDGVVAAATITVDMQTLQSDSDRRDGAIRQQALETNSFPTASFVLQEPIDLPASADSGTAFEVTAVGDLELHGVTNRISLDLSAQLVDGVIVVVGSAPILFADYAIEQPSAMAVLSVDDNGIMEFQLLFERS